MSASAQRQLSPLLRDRAQDWLRRGRGGWITARRAAAAAFLIAALALALAGPREHGARVVVAAADVAPGQLLDAAAVAVAELPADALPDGALTRLDHAVGQVMAGAARRGEVLTDLRVLSPRLTDVAAGSSDARAVPVRLADPAIARIVRAGDRVDVLAQLDTGYEVLASDAVVLFALSGEASSLAAPGQDEPLVVLALDADAAARLATAAVEGGVTVTFH
jgi:Flp pilus assembly protein CpaB